MNHHRGDGGDGWPRRWRGRWIWPSKPEPPSDSYGPQVRRTEDVFCYLRGTFHVPDKSSSGRCRVTADGRYILWINGVPVGRGPVRSEPAHLTYDSYDIGPLLRSGRNVVAVLARHYHAATLYWKPAPLVGELGDGGFLFEAEVDNSVVLATDGSWRVRAAPYRNAGRPGTWLGPPAVEVLDGREVPRDWTEQDFDDSSWESAAVLDGRGLGFVDDTPPQEPFDLLGPRPIPVLSERIVSPVSIRGRGKGTPASWLDPDPLNDFRGDESSGDLVDEPVSPVDLEAGQRVTFDFGGIVNAHPIIALNADAETVVELAAGEDIDEAGRPVITQREWTTRFTSAGGDERVESFEPVGMRYLQVSVRSGSARSVSPSALERTFPRPDGARFACSDPELDELWRVGVRSLDLCSTDAYLDCPGREQRAWLGDAYVHTVIGLVTNPDTRLAAWNLRLHAQGARQDGLLPMVASGDLTDYPITIPDYSLHFVRTLARVWEYTGDLELVTDLLPVAQRALAWFEKHRGEDGLLSDLASWIFIDWAQTERRRNIAAVDALYAMALDDCATLLDAVGDPGSASRARARADRTRAAFERYWDTSRGVYVDAADPGGPAGRRVSQQTNAVAMLSGAAPTERWEGILLYVLDPARIGVTLTPADDDPDAKRLTQQWKRPLINEETHVVLAQPFFSHFVHQAVAKAGSVERLLGLIRRWLPLAARGNGCFEEFWDAAPGEASRCHAWSATPPFDLTTHVLGVKPLEPGFTRAVIEPRLGELAWVEGSVPTPHGFITVRVERDGKAEVELPAGVEGALRFGEREIPLRSGRTVS